MNFFWLDLEMTGLDVNTNLIIECAAIISDDNFKQLESYHAVVKQDQKFLDAMDDWNKKTHGESGLIQKIPFGKPPEQVEADLIQLASKYFGTKNDERPILAGNSIFQDRTFINKYWPQFADKLHYRMLDVSAWKIILKNKYNKEYKKKKTHQALEDIRESMEELKYYMSFLKVD